MTYQTINPYSEKLLKPFNEHRDSQPELPEAPPFANAGKVKADVEIQPLASINQILIRIEHGDIASGVVLNFTRAGATNRESERISPRFASWVSSHCMKGI